MKTKIKELLDQKGYDLFTTTADMKVRTVIDILAEHNIGDVVVVDANKKLVGIVSERDVIKKCLYKKVRVDDVEVSQIMSSNVITATPEDDVEHVLALMTKNRIRHVPVITKDDEELVGLISIGDLVKLIVDSKEEENQYLRNYIDQG